MASSNRNWPSMFKSKPCNPHHQWQHDITSSLLSGCHRNPYTSGADERSPEPKPRWNPKPEQIRILETIFNSGMVNPPRDEIRKIRAQLQEYGHVGEANVFYWFQNRKSRSKHKNRHLSKNQSSQPPKTTTKQPISATPTTTTASTITNPSSSSSSSDKSSPKVLSDKNPNNPTAFSLGSYSSNLLNQLAYSPNPASLNQSYDTHVQNDPFMFPWQQLNYPNQGFTGLFPDHHTQHQPMMMASDTNLFTIPQTVSPCTEFLLSELINGQHGGSDQKKDAEEEEKLMMIKLGFAPATSASIFNVMPPPSTLNQLQDQSSGSEAMKSTVFINDVAFEVNCGEFHIREAFGNDAVLLDSNGQPVLTDEWGITLQPLQHGASYYLF